MHAQMMEASVFDAVRSRETPHLAQAIDAAPGDFPFHVGPDLFIGIDMRPGRLQKEQAQASVGRRDELAYDFRPVRGRPVDNHEYWLGGAGHQPLDELLEDLCGHRALVHDEAKPNTGAHRRDRVEGKPPSGRFDDGGFTFGRPPRTTVVVRK